MNYLSWSEFENHVPHIAKPGYELLYQYGLGLGFMATVRKDGGPRVHPCCPIVHQGGLYVFVLHTSPKRYDLDRDGRIALHSNPCPDSDDEFYCSGTAVLVEDSQLRNQVASAASHDVRDDEILYELRIDRALHTTWKNPRQPNTEPVYTKWNANTS